MWFRSVTYFFFFLTDSVDSSVIEMDQERVTLLRHRGSKLDKVKELDLFPKVEDGYKETSTVGGTGIININIYILYF